MRLIDADAFKIEFCEKCNNVSCDAPLTNTDCFTMYMLDNTPTIEAEPVRHGRWVIEGKEYRSMTVSCTSCDYVRHIYGWGLPSLKRDLKVNYLYCNKCGAKMDGGEKKNE